MRPEEEIEQKFVIECTKLGVHAYKFEILGQKGAPDRIVLLPGARVMFFEFKQPGFKMSMHQIEWNNKLLRLGFVSLVVYDWKTPLNFIKEYLKLRGIKDEKK